jgi:hypothetical protein
MGRTMVAPDSPEGTQAYARATSTLINTCYALRADGPIAVKLKED